MPELDSKTESSSSNDLDPDFRSRGDSCSMGISVFLIMFSSLEGDTGSCTRPVTAKCVVCGVTLCDDHRILTPFFNIWCCMAPHLLTDRAELASNI